MAESDPFPRGFPLDLSVRPDHTLVMDWGADGRNFVRLWLPEAVSAREQGVVFMLLREHVSLDWRRADERTLGYALGLPGRCAIEATVWSEEGALDLRLRIMNDGRGTWRDASAGVCLQLSSAPDFADFALERTVYPVGHRLVALRREDGRVGPGGLALAGRPSAKEPTGDPATSPPDAGFIAVRSKRGGHTVATGWDAVASLGNNHGAYIGCIHANPWLGEVAPGETVERRGRIYLMEGTPEEAYRRYCEDFPGKGKAD